MLNLLEGIKRKSTQKPFGMLKKKQENVPTRKPGLVPVDERRWPGRSGDYAESPPGISRVRVRFDGRDTLADVRSSGAFGRL
jgi:hypothetical protein